MCLQHRHKLASERILFCCKVRLRHQHRLTSEWILISCNMCLRHQDKLASEHILLSCKVCLRHQHELASRTVKNTGGAATTLAYASAVWPLHATAHAYHYGIPDVWLPSPLLPPLQGLMPTHTHWNPLVPPHLRWRLASLECSAPRTQEESCRCQKE